MGALSIEQVLAEEAAAILGANSRSEGMLTHPLIGQDARTKQGRMDADQRDGADVATEEVERRNAFYRSLNKLKRAALCCSGGGIRSATFCLGVIQALADYDVTSPAPPAPQQPKPAIKPDHSLLGRFHYLSTVSGGGYVGSWLSSWRVRNDFPTLIRNLTGRPDGADIEPPEISWLRAYSNYLTPRIVGIASADAWAAVAIMVRNLILNWLIIIPVVCMALLVMKVIATGAVRLARDVNDGRIIGSVVLGVISLLIAQAFTTRHRPTRQVQVGTVREPTFLRRDLAWGLVSALGVAIFFSSRYVSSLLAADWARSSAKAEVLTAGAGFLIYSAGWIAGWPRLRSGRDFICWAGSGLVYGALVGLGAHLYTLLQPYPTAATACDRHWCLLLPIIFGVPWVLTAQLAADVIFVGLTSYENNADSDREWLGRAAGWLAASAVVLALTAFLVFAGEYAIQASVFSIKQLVGVGGISGIATALLGKSSRTPAKATSHQQGDPTTIAFNIALAVVGPIFAAALIIGLSLALDKMLLGSSLVELLLAPKPVTRNILSWLAGGMVIAAAIGWLASGCVNINRFSLHALYRNRLVRCYLGASRQERDPDQFTGFDIKDNIAVHDLWPPKAGGGMRSHCLFHVVNIALNVVSTKRLAWQERKAEPFTVSPRHCGSAYLGFRPSAEYGDYPGKGGLTLGTAMAISGAAVSPNMGYHSSPSMALLLTLFNVRLGWWLGNPGAAGDESYQSDGPKFAAKPLFAEAFGQTTDQRPYVYLSDGGHFENLGLYEMVRRRCRFIVVIDAGCDPGFTFEDLGNAVRKIYIDLGIRIQFDDLQTIRNRPPQKAARYRSAGPVDDLREQIPYYAIGAIDYESADGFENGCANGYILYIKPAYHGTEGAGIRSYASAHPAFPHESTADQWFTESQFESYRSLGLDIANSILGQEVVLQMQPSKLTLHDVLAALHNP